MTRPPPPDATPTPPRRQHTDADPSNVVTETQVPNEAKALPSHKPAARVLAFGGAGVALLAVICEYFGMNLVALILVVIAVLMCGMALIMAINDVRTGRGVPVACLVVSTIVFIIVLLDVFGVDEAVRDAQRDLRPAPVTTAGDEEVPANPADIVEGRDETPPQ